MLAKSLNALALSALLAASPALAQEAPETPEFLLELNAAADNDQGCWLTYVATNRTGAALSEVSYEVAVFDASGIVTRLLLLDFGAFPEGKTKVVQFGLGSACAGFSRILVNQQASCTLAEGGASDVCMSGLATASRAAIQFGL